MGLINDVVGLYKASSEEKRNVIVDKFIKLIWQSKCEYKTIIKRIQFEIDDTIVDEELFDILCKYNDLQYKKIKSKYRSEKMTSIDYIRVHINNSYAFLFDKDTYATKEYVFNLLQPRDAYFQYIREEIEREELLLKLQEFNNNNINKRTKHELTWNQYKKIINSFLVRIFDNIKTVDELLSEIDFEQRVKKDTFDYDNILIAYINNCITGYLRNYIKELDKPKYKFCSVCGVYIEDPKPRQKYCWLCWKKEEKRLKREWWHKNRH